MDSPAHVAGQLLGERIGLRVDGSTRHRLARAVTEAAERSGAEPLEWAASLARDEPEVQRLVDRVTVQETAFFRHPEQFDLLSDHLAGAPSSGMIWSAGCATGQEPWSVAMLLEELCLHGWSVLATDVSQDALRRAEAGVYTPRELKGLSRERRGRFLRRCDGALEVRPGLRSRVRFLVHNLVHDPPPPPVRAVLCRNVLIYMTAEHGERAIRALHETVAEDGILIVGAAESLPIGHPLFRPERRHAGFVYRPQRAAAPPVADVPPPAEPRPAPAPGDAAARRPAPAPAEPPARLPTRAQLLADGEAMAAAARHAEAAACFRKAVFLDPSDAVAHVGLALALEAARDPGAERARRAARAAVAASDARALRRELEGWSVGEIERVLEQKLE